MPRTIGVDLKTNSERVDPLHVLREARDLVSHGEYPKALTKYRWFHDEALVHDPDVYGVRRSFALRYWKELGDIYPPARAELEAVRDLKTKALREGSSDRELFGDVSAINQYLGQVQQTSSLFTSLAERDEEFARRCFSTARSALVQTRDYPLARTFIRSPREIVERLAGRLNRSIGEIPPADTRSSSILQKAEIENYVEDIQQLLEILTGVGEADEAQRLRSMAIDSIESGEIRAEVRELLA